MSDAVRRVSGAARSGRPVIHFSKLLTAPVVAKSGETIGKVEDVIVQLGGPDAYPLVTGCVVGVGDRQVFVSADSVAEWNQDRVLLTKNKVDLRGFERREGEYLLRADVLDHRFIDVPNAELVHAYDVELEDTGHGWALARLDTRRPARLFGLIPSAGGDAGRDWKAFEPMIGHDQSLQTRRVAGRVHTLKPAQIADLLEDANEAEGGEILGRMQSDPELEADVFEELDPHEASRLFDGMTDGEVAAVLGRMRADDAADAVIDLRKSGRGAVLDLMPAGRRALLVTLMGFNPDSAGGLMTVDVVSCTLETTAAQALSIIAEARALQPEALLKMHVLSDTGQLVGVVSVIRLLQADPTTGVCELVDVDPVRVSPEVEVADIALLMSDFNLGTLPVVDERDHVLGVVTYDDILEALIPEGWRRRDPAPRPIGAHPADLGSAGYRSSAADQTEPTSPDVVSPWAKAASIRSRLRQLQLHRVELPIVGQVPVPDTRDVVYLTTLAALITLGIVEWPIALAVLGGHALVKQQHSRTLSTIGEVVEDFWLR